MDGKGAKKKRNAKKDNGSIPPPVVPSNKRIKLDQGGEEGRAQGSGNIGYQESEQSIDIMD